MDELTIGDKIYISSKRAAKITGYAKDYVGQLCREGRVEARLVGRNWYVLESSITEHRFGPVEEDKKAAQEPEKDTYQWKSPTYVAEDPVPVPSLIRKEPEVIASRKVVSEMQAAWQEWFAQQPVPLQATQQPEEAKIDAPEEEYQLGEEEVQFTAVYEEPAPIVHHEVLPEPEYSYSAMTEVMDLSRSYEPAPTLEEDGEGKEEEEEVHAHYQDRNAQKGSMTVLRAMFIGVALIAGATALVGTGVIGDILSKSYGTESQLGKTIKYLGGESVYINSSK